MTQLYKTWTGFELVYDATRQPDNQMYQSPNNVIFDTCDIHNFILILIKKMCIILY